ncbi:MULTISPECIES: hypothetical protein [Tsukamurella]|uniref:Uncharacterized protein n=2 Tax=Tsukamurella TaxID=2060 RepID=A0A5C5RXY0_9ACTN|nr:MULTISPECIES: hypothetical protein [Tsukamurella]NMD56546.1 hypothetical protein [Tsukamurella columbiensis]TWS27522.1 hypothetical protein FK530_18570 [Tsukamurella conjunctivitidis]
MTAAAERTALLASAVSAALLPVAGLGAALLSPEWQSLYTPALALPALAHGLVNGLRWRDADPMSKEPWCPRPEP